MDDYAFSLIKIGDVRGKRDTALLREALTIYSELAAKYPTIARYQTNLAHVQQLLEEQE